MAVVADAVDEDGGAVLEGFVVVFVDDAVDGHEHRGVAERGDLLEELAADGLYRA